MTTPRKTVPDHVRGPVEAARDDFMRIKGELQRLIDIARYAAQSDDVDGWRALAHAVSQAGTCINLAADGIRELESIEGVDQPPDESVIHLRQRGGGER